MPARHSVILLAGGLGTRLSGLYPEIPKPMIPVAGRPFLEWSLRYWFQQGFRHFILSTGYRNEVVARHFDDQPLTGAEIVAHAETRPLGTGGAIRAAAGVSGCSDPFVVANGDSLLLADVRTLFEALTSDSVDGLMLALEVEDTSRFGSIETDAGGRLIRFREKRPGRGLINAGVYVLRRRLLEMFPSLEPLSMETEAIPALLDAGADIRVVRADASFLDIGTPDSLSEAGEFIRANSTCFGVLNHEPVSDQLL